MMKNGFGYIHTVKMKVYTTLLECVYVAIGIPIYKHCLSIITYRIKRFSGVTPFQELVYFNG